MIYPKPFKVWPLLFMFILLTVSRMSAAQNNLPPEIQKEVGNAFQPLGTGIYRKFGLPIYAATLWAPDGKWDRSKPCILVLTYKRDLSKDLLVSNLTESIRDQETADDETVDKWEKTLNEVIPPVQDGDTMIGIALPSQPVKIFYNDKQIARLEDLDLSRAFLNIWLGDHANPGLKADLLSQP